MLSLSVGHGENKKSFSVFFKAKTARQSDCEIFADANEIMRIHRTEFSSWSLSVFCATEEKDNV